jgi:hypothetical protein
LKKGRSRQYNGQKQKDKQWSTKHYKNTKDWATRTSLKTKDWATRTSLKTKDWATRTSLKTGGELRCSGKMSCSWSTSYTNIIWYGNHIKRFELKKVLSIYKCLANNMSLLKYMYFTGFHVSHWYNYKDDCLQ